MLQILKQNQKHFSMYLVLLLIFAVFGFMTDFVNFKPRNITNLVIQNSYILILAVGMVMVIITGKIDLSVGSVVALTGAVSAWAYNQSGSIVVAILASLMVGALIGAFQGYWIAYLKVPAFIVTLAGMLGWRGLTYIFTNLQTIGLKDSDFKTITTGFIDLGSDDMTQRLALAIGMIFALILVVMDARRRAGRVRLGFDVLPIPLFLLKNICISAIVLAVFYAFSQDRGVPIVVTLIAFLVVFFTFVMNNTVFGRNIYAIGGNAKAAKLSGINAERTEFYVFVLMGVLAAFAGVIYTAYMNSAANDAGNMFELDAISAVFIGGASATGGVGTIIGSIIGGLVMGVINNGMNLMSLGAEYQLVVKALVLLVAVWYDLYNNKKSS